MAKTDLETLQISLNADLKQYEKALAKASQITVTQLRKMENASRASATRVEKNLNGIGSSLKAFGGGLVSGFLTVGGLKAIRTAVSSIADIGDAADNLGLTTDEFQAMAGAAQLAGVETEALAKGLKTLGVNTADAANGQGDLGKLFAANGISIKDVNGNLLSQQEILLRVADLVKNSASEQEKLAIAQIALGKAGAGLVNLLEQGASGVAGAFATASAAMGSFTAEQIEAARKIDDEFDILEKKMNVSLKGAFLDLAVVGESAFLQISGGINTAIEKGGILAKILQGIADNLPGSKITKENPWFSLTVGGKTIIGNEENNLPSTPGNTAGKSSLPTNIDSSGTLAKPTKQIDKTTAAVANLIPKVAELTAGEQYLQRIYEQQLETEQQLYDSKMALAELAVGAFDAIIIGGEKAEDVLKNLVKQLASAALQATFLGQGPLAGLFGTGSTGGFFGSLFKAPKLYAKGGTIGAGKWGIAGEAGPELIQGPATVTPIGKMTGGGNSMSLNIVINAPGADAAGLAQVRAEIQNLNRNLPKIIKNTVSGEKALNPRFAR